jgi:hypothetical protein
MLKLSFLYLNIRTDQSFGTSEVLQLFLTPCVGIINQPAVVIRLKFVIYIIYIFLLLPFSLESENRKSEK